MMYPADTVTTEHVGDLGGKFKREISEYLHAPLWSSGLLILGSIRKVQDVSSPGYNGIEQVFMNPTAPVKKKIMVLGNSFFERVPSWGLSPFFTALFQEFYFIWSPGIDVSAIKLFRLIL